MKKLQTSLMATALAASFAGAGMMQATAAPILLSKPAHAQSDVIQVRDGWYRGHRGYRNFRPGYRYNDGWWFPAGAFVAGALIGGAIANSNYYGGYGGGYGPRYYLDEPGYYAPRYVEPGPVYYPSRSSYRAGYQDGYRDGYYGRRPVGVFNCTDRMQSAGRC